MRILMVCLGNICRSPLAEGVLQQLSAQQNLDWHVDSAGTGDWHKGEQPDQRSIAIAAQNGFDITNQRARQIKQHDFARFDHILVMDNSNLSNVRALAPPEHAHKIRRLLDLLPDADTREVPDPYYNNQFQLTFDLVHRACTHIVEHPHLLL